MKPFAYPLLTGLLVFLILIVLNQFNLYPHSALRAGIAGGVSSILAGWILRATGVEPKRR